MVCLFKHTYIVRFGKLEPLSHFMIFVHFWLCSVVILSNFAKLSRSSSSSWAGFILSFTCRWAAQHCMWAAQQCTWAAQHCSWAAQNPGKVLPSSIPASQLKLGSDSI
jgi:hypothetical protein